jgi:hypothetical protein
MSRTVTDRLEASRQSSPEAPVRRSQLVLLTSIAILGAACGGEDQSSPRTSRAVESTQQLATLEGLLPGELGSVRLRREAFTGSAWLRASPEEAFSPEVSVDISRFLERLREPSSDLTVAWAIAQSGPKVVAYQVRGATAQALVDAYVGAIRERLGRGTLRVARRLLWGKEITVTSHGLPTSRGYLYANDGTLFTAWSDHISARELAELIPRLP